MKSFRRLTARSSASTVASSACDGGGIDPPRRIERNPPPPSLRTVIIVLLFAVSLCIGIMLWFPPTSAAGRDPSRGSSPPHIAVESRVSSKSAARGEHVVNHTDEAPRKTVMQHRPVEQRADLPSLTPKSELGLLLAILTTVKPCAEDNALLDAQIAAIASWCALPLRPSPSVYIFDTEQQHSSAGPTCAERIHEVVKSTSVIRSAAVTSPSGTLLLGAALKMLRQLAPSADVLAVINADIMLSPSAAARALEAAHALFNSFFIVGRRRTVDLRDEAVRAKLLPRVVESRMHRRAPVVDGSANVDPFSLHELFESSDFTAASVVDRVDAEDYFFFTPLYFDHLPYPVPNFHIGRPVYDNWLVHTAIHTLQPVIDGSDVIAAYHLKHDYRHLSRQPAVGASGDATYWGSENQKDNYNTALSHGGWQHGLIDFVPLRFLAASSSGSITEISLKPTWKPFADSAAEGNAAILSNLGAYLEKLKEAVRPAERMRWNQALRNHLKMRRQG